jgi:hypothetical protein
MESALARMAGEFRTASGSRTATRPKRLCQAKLPSSAFPREDQGWKGTKTRPVSPVRLPNSDQRDSAAA